jgi:hypothetical protein
MTKNEVIAQLKAEHPTLRIGDEESGYTNLDAEKYEATIEQWADNQLAEEAQAIKVEETKLAKQALLAKLGITAEEAALLLGGN